MATKSNKSAMTKVGKAVKKAAKTVAKKTDEYVVEPVSKALGVKGKKKPAAKKAAKSTAASKKAGATAKSSTAKKAKPAARSK
jgi:hypothetical protein